MKERGLRSREAVQAWGSHTNPTEKGGPLWQRMFRSIFIVTAPW